MDNEWWRSGVVYQIYPRSFADSNGDGIGDLRGAINKIDHLVDLGVDAVWLSPMYKSPGDDNGYDVSDYQAIDPQYGTMEDFDELLAGLHARGIRLVLDLVVNHTSDEHEWFVESASAIDSPKRDWYIWRPPRPGHAPGSKGAEPTDWESFFSESTWKLDEASGEYFLHLFSTKQPDLNWENPRVREAIYSMMNWWLDRGVDGFRMDVINLISKVADLRDGEPVPGKVRSDGSAQYTYGPRLHEFLQEMHSAVFAGRPSAIVTVGEMPRVTVEQARLITDASRHELDMVFQFEHMEVDKVPGTRYESIPLNLARLKGSLARWQEGLADTGWNTLYWNNHDQARAVSRYGDDREYWRESAKTLATALYLLRGTAFIYQGEELGMTNTPLESADELLDVAARNYHRSAMASGVSESAILAQLRRAGRDNARSPMQWDSQAGAGFSAGIPWSKVNPNADRINAAAQRDDPLSVLAHYRRVIKFRHENDVVASGRVDWLALDHPELFTYLRNNGDVQLLVVANFSSRVIDLPEELVERIRDAQGAVQLDSLGIDGRPGAQLAPWRSFVIG